MTRCTDKRQENYAGIGFRIPHSGTEAQFLQMSGNCSLLLIAGISRFIAFKTGRKIKKSTECLVSNISDKTLIMTMFASNMECSSSFYHLTTRFLKIQFHGSSCSLFPSKRPPTIVKMIYISHFQSRKEKNETIIVRPSCTSFNSWTNKSLTIHLSFCQSFYQ